MAACSGCKDISTSINRKKTLDSDLMTTNLDRCLGISDLILMGIGYMVGTGLFILTGEVVRYHAGASAILSYVISGIAATLSAICYAEFAAFVPLAGSSYTYIYVVIGELWGFFAGWNIVLEYVLGSAAAAKSWSGTLDALFNGSIGHGIENSIGGFHNKWMGEYPDFIAVLVIAAVTIFVMIGAKTSSNFNKVMVFFKLVTILIIVIAGFMLADISNWTDPAKGGFFPYGVSGTLAGAATCFYAFVGFDGLAVASEETKNPKRAIPISIIASMLIVTFLYVLTSTVLTLMVPFYDVDPLSPYPQAFAQRGESWATYVVGVGTLFGLASVLLAGLFSLPRVIFAMARDGLLFSALAYVHPKTQTPILPIGLIGITGAVLALFLNLNVLIDLLSIGTLFSFTFVSACIIIIRYDEPIIKIAPDTAIELTTKENIPLKDHADFLSTYSEPSNNDSTFSEPSYSDSAAVLDTSNEKFYTKLSKIHKEFLSKYNTHRLILFLLAVMILNINIFVLMFVLAFDDITSVKWWAVILLVLTSIGIIMPLLIIGSMEQVPRRDSFQVPWVPFLPAISIFCNMGLMLMLDWLTWVRLFCWLLIGFLVYFFYGMKHSKEGRRNLEPPYIDLNESIK